MTYYSECICECGDMLCTGFNWCADCAEWHHGEPCATEALDDQDELTQEQAALDAEYCAGLEAAQDETAYCRYGY